MGVAMARLMNGTPLELQTGIVEGITRTRKLAKQMGITSSLKPFPALALGASDLTLLEITSAYGSFANEGIYAKPISIQFVENRAGEILIENQVSRRRVLNQNVSY